MLSSVLLILTMCVSGYAVLPETLSESAITAFLSAHNKLRSSLSLPDLVWNSTLASVAEELVSKCIWKHSTNKYGENMYASMPKKPDTSILANDAVTMWAAGVTYVDPKWLCISLSPGLCGQYSQLVWKNTTRVGCSIAHCTGAIENYVVCEYDPPGNINGQVPY